MTSVKKVATGWTTRIAESEARVEDGRSNAAASDSDGDRILAISPS